MTACAVPSLLWIPGVRVMATDRSPKTARDRMSSREWQRCLPVYVIVSLYAAGMAAVLPVLPFYVRDMGGSPFTLGMVVATEALSQFTSAPVLGQLSDRFGRKRILLVSQLTGSVSLLMLAVEPGIVMVMFARALFGMTAGNIPVAAACIAEYTLPAYRRQTMGILTGSVGLGGIVGAALSGLLSEYSLATPLFAAVILTLVAAIVTFFLPDNGPVVSPTGERCRFSRRFVQGRADVARDPYPDYCDAVSLFCLRPVQFTDACFSRGNVYLGGSCVRNKTAQLYHYGGWHHQCPRPDIPAGLAEQICYGADSDSSHLYVNRLRVRGCRPCRHYPGTGPCGAVHQYGRCAGEAHLSCCAVRSRSTGTTGCRAGKCAGYERSHGHILTPAGWIYSRLRTLRYLARHSRIRRHCRGRHGVDISPQGYSGGGCG